MTEYDLLLAISLDLIVVICCVFFLARHGRLAHSHPLTIYLFFHLYVVTARLIAVASGAPTLFSGWGFGYVPVTEDELVRAALLLDVALVLATVAGLKASYDDARVQGQTANGVEYPENLRTKYVNRVVAFTIPIGIVGLLLFANLPLVDTRPDLGAWGQSSWLVITVTWFGLSLLALIYVYGFRKALMFLMILYLIIMVYQGFHRFRVIIPLLLMVQIYLDRHGRRWPNIWLMGIAVVVGLLFFPLKGIGQTLQGDQSTAVLIDHTTTSIEQALDGRAGDQEFLDQFASMLTLVDQHDSYFYGQTYLALLTLPVPRVWWPDKPGLADWFGEISRSWRPMARSGMIATYLGETYANFWYFGILFLPVLLFYFLTRFYFWAYRHPYYSVAHFAYLLLAANLIQVYRDGLISIVVFVFVNMMPLVMIVLVHVLVRPRKRPRQLTVPPQTREKAL